MASAKKSAKKAAKKTTGKKTAAKKTKPAAKRGAKATKRVAKKVAKKAARAKKVTRVASTSMETSLQAMIAVLKGGALSVVGLIEKLGRSRPTIYAHLRAVEAQGHKIVRGAERAANSTRGPMATTYTLAA